MRNLILAAYTATITLNALVIPYLFLDAYTPQAIIISIATPILLIHGFRAHRKTEAN